MTTIKGRLAEYELDDTYKPKSGACGIVFKARDCNTGRNVALKTLLETHLEDNNVMRFRKEAAFMEGLKEHPNVVRIYEHFGFREKPYIAMEWADHSLRDLLDRSEGHKLKPPKAISAALCILNALEYAHAKGITHLDIHPGNILFDSNGAIKLSDFGLARIFWDSEEGQEILRGMQQDRTISMGYLLEPDSFFDPRNTPLTNDYLRMRRVSIANFVTYAPPELLDPKRQLTKGELVRADIYSATMVLYEMLVGRVSKQRIGRVNPAWSKINLEGILEKGMDDENKQRYDSVKDMQKALSKWNKPVISLWERVNTPVGRTLAGISSALVLGGILFATVPYFKGRFERRRNGIEQVAEEDNLRNFGLRYNNIRLISKTKPKEAYVSLNGLLKEIDQVPQQDKIRTMRQQMLSWRENEFLPYLVDFYLDHYEGKNVVEEDIKAIENLFIFIASERFSGREEALIRAVRLHKKELVFFERDYKRSFDLFNSGKVEESEALNKELLKKIKEFEASAVFAGLEKWR